MEYVIGALILGSIMPTVINYFTNRTLKSLSNKMEEKKKSEQDFNILIIESIQALAENDKAIFEALKTGKANGNLQRAMDNLDKINTKLNRFLMTQATKD